MNANAQRAAHLLKHYMRLLAEASGIEWDSDNDSEVEQIVDTIIAAAREPEEENEALAEYRYRKAQAQAYLKAERGE